MKRAAGLMDLHIHSKYSCDGEYSPSDLAGMAAAAGIEVMALTDHNTTGGIREALEAGAKNGIKVIPGIELDCMFKGHIFHVLGYGIDPNFPALDVLYIDVRRQEAAAARERIRLINKAGIELDETEALSSAVHGCFVTGELIAELVLNKSGAKKNPLLRPYLPGGSRSDNPYVNFYWDFCAQGKKAYVPITYIALEKAVSIIRLAGGISVLAHPGQNLKGKYEWLADIIRAGIDGIEAYSSYHSSEECIYFAGAAEKHKLLVSGGSDFHGKTKPAVKMGSFGFSGSARKIIKPLEERIQACRLVPVL
ncbi:PHP domain-containing protein [Treponema sp. OttesenSCG-928-L16]|nr:PHP domain-containing protein [Treponema sp. OttesenSCG-928-L16]